MAMQLKSFKIIEFPNASASTSFRVTGTLPDGTRIRKNFASHAEALGEKQILETKALNQPVHERMKRTVLSNKQIKEAQRAFEELDGQSLMGAVRYYLDNYSEPVRNITLSKAFDQFLQEKKAINSRPLTIRNFESRVGFLVNKYPQKLVSNISSDLLKEIVLRPGISPVTQDNDRRALGSFFSWATKQGYCGENPITKIDRIKTDRTEPEILSLNEVRNLLNAAQTYKGGVVLPYIALGVFAAIRPNELSGLTWKDIDLEEGIITIGSKIAKMRQRRLVEISDNLIDWLSPFALQSGPIKKKNWRRDFEKIKQLAEIKKWIPDILRHTAISYHLALHQNEGETALWAGSSPDIIQRHYRGLVKRKEAELFWSIKPSCLKQDIITLAS